MAVLEVNHLEKHFGSTRVLNDISFSLEKGQALSIIGSSGSGKTTLLRCLNFLETPNGGSICVNGKTLFDAADPSTQLEKEIRRKRLHFGLVFQNFNLFPQYNVMGNLTLAPKLHAKERADFKINKKQIYAEIDARAEEILRVTGLIEKKDSYPYQLSGGQQQRVAIARALMLSPKILCFDEPTSALDPELTGEVLKVIRELKNSDRTMVIVTHEIGFAKGVSDKVIFMADGVIEEFGTPQEVLENPKSPKTIAFLKNAKD